MMCSMITMVLQLAPMLSALEFVWEWIEQEVGVMKWKKKKKKWMEG
jgi:hypothetical protein